MLPASNIKILPLHVHSVRTKIVCLQVYNHRPVLYPAEQTERQCKGKDGKGGSSAGLWLQLGSKRPVTGAKREEREREGGEGMD